MLTITYAVVISLAGALLAAVSGVLIRRYYRKAWYGLWAGAVLFLLGAIYTLVWLGCYGG